MYDVILDDYFEWLYYMAVYDEDMRRYKKLLGMLHDMEYRYFVEYDENRASDGENLRWYYVDDGGEPDILKWKEPCTVLEMMLSVALHMMNISGEMDTRYWFWRMLDNLDLAWMTDSSYDGDYIYGKISLFLDRDYEPDGNGNIIHIPGCKEDLRKVEIWCQICWYLDYIL